MSVRRQALQYTVAAIAIAALVIVASTYYLNPAVLGGKQAGTATKLSIRLTDPPLVPSGTTSLNITYSSIGVLVAGPSGVSTVTVTPSGGSATLDLLKLVNISQTLGSASIPAGSTVYSFSFAVTSISIDVSGTKSPVTLATGGSTLTVTLANPYTVNGDSVALLRLDPAIVLTSSGYELIPSAVGVVRGESQGEHNGDEVGSKEQVTSEDDKELDQARGSVSATLTALSVTGDVTTITVEVKNTGNGPVDINGIGIHGDFTQVGQDCNAGGNQHGSESTSTTTTTTTTTTTSTGVNGCGRQNEEEVVFIPGSSSVSGTACVSVNMHLVNGDHSENGNHALTLAKGQCVDLTFTGTISFGESKAVLIPLTAAGQVYEVHVIASEGANVVLSCKLPVSSTSCSVENHGQD